MGTKTHRRAQGHALSEDEEAVQDVGVDVEETANAPTAEGASPFDDRGFADFAITGTNASGEFRCTDCGYGAVVHRVLPPCPMCGSTVWESRGPRVVD